MEQPTLNCQNPDCGKPLLPSREWWRRKYCDAKCNARARRIRLSQSDAPKKQAVCTHCKQDFAWGPLGCKPMFCQDPLCQKAKQAHIQNMRKASWMPKSRAYELRKANMMKVKKYPCRICGKRTVNRFYCHMHHQQLSESYGSGIDTIYGVTI